jgi:hypothetical protein
VSLKVSLCPYSHASYWQAVKSGLGSICDQVYLQCYEGGAGNNPATWNNYFGGLKVIPGYWDWERDNTFLNYMQAWKSAGGSGGFLWPSCTGCNPPADGNEMKQYAYQILNTYNPVVLPVTAADVVGSQVSFTASSFAGSNLAYQWQMIRGGVTNNIAGATNTTLTLRDLRLTNTESYQLQASNALGVSVSSAGSLTVSSVPTAVNNVIASYAAQTGLGYGFTLTPNWPIAPDSIINGQAPSSTNGNFSMEVPGRNVNALTGSGSLAITLIAGTSGNTTSTNYVTCGNSSGAGSLVTYTLTNLSAGGYTLTNIVVYGGWADAGRDQQAYTVYYSKVTAPSTFILLGSANYNPVNGASVPSATRTTLTPASGALASNVAAVKFDFTTPASESGYCGYARIQLFGTPVSPVVATNTLPVTAADVVGSQVILTAGFTSASQLSYQWRVISGGATNDIPGTTNTTLTLANLQLTNTASYQLQASNAYEVAVRAPGALTVSSMPASVNNVITAIATQTGLGNGSTFTPTWTVSTNDSLIAGWSPSSTTGNFSLEIPGRSVNCLTAGGSGALAIIPATSGYTSTTNYVTCGNSGGAGSSVLYSLTSATNGYNLTNIVVYGGWADGGRDQQAYTVYYSRATAPAKFYLLGSVNYNPSNPANAQSATRATIRPASGALATNVATVKFDFSTPASENGYCGYSQIELFGVPVQVLAPPATNPTNITFRYTANSLTLTWPGDHTGWRLQVQTNNPANGLGTNWWDFAGSISTNQMTLPINSTDGSVFYRLAYP